MVDFEIWIWLTKKNHDSSYARVKIFGNYLMKSPNKPKNFFFHEIHGWPAFAYLDWPKWLQNCPFDEWWSHQLLESDSKKWRGLSLTGLFQLSYDINKSERKKELSPSAVLPDNRSVIFSNQTSVSNHQQCGNLLRHKTRYKYTSCKPAQHFWNTQEFRPNPWPSNSLMMFVCFVTLSQSFFISMVLVYIPGKHALQLYTVCLCINIIKQSVINPTIFTAAPQKGPRNFQLLAIRTPKKYLISM